MFTIKIIVNNYSMIKSKKTKESKERKERKERKETKERKEINRSKGSKEAIDEAKNLKNSKNTKDSFSDIDDKFAFAFEDNFAKGTKRTFESGGYTEKQFVTFGDKVKGDEWKAKLDYAFEDNLAGGTESIFGKDGAIDSNFIQPTGEVLKPAGEAVGGFFESKGGYTAFHADQTPKYIPPYMMRKIKSQQAKEVNVAKVMAGTGPISMVVVYLLDFGVDLIIWLITTFGKLFADGFDFAYGGLLGEYKGIFPEDNKYGSYYSFRFLRTFITIITPPVGVFMAKGVKGWMNILICLILCYIHYVIGILYAFVITFKNKYADRYEKVQEQKMAQIKAEQEAAGQGTITDYAYIVGSIIFVGAILFVILLVLKQM
jgi:uncharacterized membrane protein YqaE (UPF0057 family)